MCGRYLEIGGKPTESKVSPACTLGTGPVRVPKGDLEGTACLLDTNDKRALAAGFKDGYISKYLLLI